MSPDSTVKHIAPEGHPIHTLMEEHAMVLSFAAKLTELTKEINGSKTETSGEEQLKQLNHIIHHFRESQRHYLREENVLFSYMEKHGITGPPRAMWMEHDQIRSIENQIFKLTDNIDSPGIPLIAEQLKPLAEKLLQLLGSHFNKENNVLFPMAMQSLTEDEWKQTVKEFTEIGYCCFTPKSALQNLAEDKVEVVDQTEKGLIDLASGKLAVEELLATLNSLPVDITFVDKDDTFRYFNVTRHPIFTRTKSAIGLKVQQCHPQKSVHKVNKILEDFKSGARDSTGFWINMNNRLIYIRYFAVRNDAGEYLGCMEVTQDITDIQKITGEKRLLDD